MDRSTGNRLQAMMRTIRGFDWTPRPRRPILMQDQESSARTMAATRGKILSACRRKAQLFSELVCDRTSQILDAMQVGGVLERKVSSSYGEGERIYRND